MRSIGETFIALALITEAFIAAGVFTVGFIAAPLLIELARHDTGIVIEPGLRLRKTGMGLCSFQVD
jgi:hypothetical protein